MSIKTLIVDDEAVARRGLRALLEPYPEFEVCGEARNGAEAVERIAQLQPDVVFLDIQMPELNGFEVIQSLGDPLPVVVFLTAFDEFALRAFDAHALDYLLKPVREERFDRTITRVLEQVRQQRLGRAAQNLREALAELGPPRIQNQTSRGAEPYLDRLAIRDSDTVSFVRTADVDWLESADYYTRVHVGARSHLVRETMQQLEQRLDPTRFVRVHRSALVNIERIRQVVAITRAHHEIVLSTGTRLPLSRRRREALERALGQRI